MATKKVNTKTLIEQQLREKQNQVSTTLKLPELKEEIKNVETLNSKNFIDTDNISLPDEIKNSKIAEGVEKNTPGMSTCIKEKIKDLAGVFTVPLGLPSFDQFNIPTDIENLDPTKINLKDAFTATFNDIKQTVKDTVDGIKNAFKFNKQTKLDQIETGELSLRKFLGCDELPTQFTPRERKNAGLDPSIIQTKIEQGIKESQTALTNETNKLIDQRTVLLADKSKQQAISTITDVESILS